MPKETALGLGERGVENGCAMPVEVAAGFPAVLGEVVVEGSSCRVVKPNAREIERDGRAREERKQLAHIILVGDDG